MRDISPSDRGQRDAREYWRRNLRIVAVLLAIWFVVSYGAGILFAERLNDIRIPGTGFPLGFWFAQQGSIYVFVVLIFVYVFLMNRLDRAFDVDETDAPASAAPGAARGDPVAGGSSERREPPAVTGGRRSDEA